MNKTISLGLLRISMGFIFLWAFLDKFFGLGFATGPEKSWISGASPTAGFLGNATKGPFVDFFHSLAGLVWVDWLFMSGLLLIGLALILGIAMRLAFLGGGLLLTFMYLAVLPPANNPIVDDHIIYFLVLLVLMFYKADEFIGFGKKWKDLKLVRALPFLA